MIEAAPATAWYLYAFVAPCTADLRSAIEQLTGVGTARLSVVGDERLAAVVGAVPLDEFGEEALQRQLNDRDWLEEKARAHEHVLERLVELTTVVPLRFGAIFEDSTSVERTLERRRDELERTVAHVRGRVELGVQAWLDRRAGSEPPPAASGRAYLERKRDERVEAEAAAVRLQELLGDAHDRLLALAVDGVVNRPQPRELTGRNEEMVFNAAYLVPAGDDALAREVASLDARHRSHGLSYRVTGPWPAHNFVAPDESR